MADDDDPVLLRLPDPLAGRLRDRPRRRPPRRRRRAAARSGGATAGSPRSGGSRLREGVPSSRYRQGSPRRLATTSMPGLGEMLGRPPARRSTVRLVVAGRDGTPRDVGAAAADAAARLAGQGQDAESVVERRGGGAPAGLAPVLGPGTRLVDVAAGRRRRFARPSRPARRRWPRGSPSSGVAPAVAPERGRVPLAAEAVAPARPLDPRSLRALVHLPAERIEDEVPRPDVADLAPTEAGLEMGDPASRQAPQVVARRALLARRSDRLPLEEVVRPRVAALAGSSRRTARRRAARSGRGRASPAACPSAVWANRSRARPCGRKASQTSR